MSRDDFIYGFAMSTTHGCAVPMFHFNVCNLYIGYFSKSNTYIWLVYGLGEDQKNKHHNDTCSKEIGLRCQISQAMHSTTNNDNNREDLLLRNQQTCTCDDHNWIRGYGQSSQWNENWSTFIKVNNSKENGGKEKKQLESTCQSPIGTKKKILRATSHVRHFERHASTHAELSSDSGRSHCHLWSFESGPA